MPRKKKTPNTLPEKSSLAGNHSGREMTLSGPSPAPDQDIDLIKQTLRAIMLDTNAPAAAKAQAARTMAEIAGALGKHSKPGGIVSGRPLAELTREELEAELAASGG
jgi:hypothetical protein